MSILEETISTIGLLDPAAAVEAQKHLDNLTKPRGSLGRLETIACRLVAITGSTRPTLGRKVIYTLAGDHGVACEGVSAYPQAVTEQMVYNFLRGGAGINVLARQSGARVVIADFGVAADMKPHPDLVHRKVAHGTRNIRREPAMTRAEAVRSVENGIGLVSDVDLAGTGEMGIANTTAASAITAVITGRPVAEVTGRGTGIGDDALSLKISVIEEAISLHRPDSSDGLDVLSKVGGFEIGGLVGIILGAAARRIPVVVDGFISGAAALLAVTLAPASRDYLFSSHLSVERGHVASLEWLRIKPILDLDLRLGEGTGAALAFHILEAAVRINNEMATFAEAGVSEES